MSRWTSSINKKKASLKGLSEATFGKEISAVHQMLLSTGLKRPYLNYCSISLTNLPDMKAFFLTLFLASLSIHTLFAQQDTTALLNLVEAKLETGVANVSSVLSDKRYLLLHPKPAFREMIKKNSSADVLTITTDDEPGKKIKVTGIVKNGDDQPIANALVYLYQTDSRGWYAADAPHVLVYEGDIRHARLFGYVKTGSDGKFELHTVKPSGYPGSDLPAHIHIHVVADGYDSYGTEFLFDDDDRLVGNIREQSVRSQFLIARPEPAEASFAQKFSYTMTLRKK
jgi:protocatechuate 3,4-dioxygenase beta subunit